MPGVAFVDKLNRKTSAGFPWKTSKKRFLVTQDCGIHSDCVTFNDEMLGRIECI
jgi:hypothetical protein